jgi:hypothetical protein
MTHFTFLYELNAISKTICILDIEKDVGVVLRISCIDVIFIPFVHTHVFMYRSLCITIVLLKLVNNRGRSVSCVSIQVPGFEFDSQAVLM